MICWASFFPSPGMCPSSFSGAALMLILEGSTGTMMLDWTGVRPVVPAYTVGSLAVGRCLSQKNRLTPTAAMAPAAASILFLFDRPGPEVCAARPRAITGKHSETASFAISPQAEQNRAVVIRPLHSVHFASGAN